MLAYRSSMFWRNGSKRSFGLVVPRFSAFYTSIRQGEGHLDHQIEELNQELESVFGPSAKNERISPLSSATSSCTSSSSSAHESISFSSKEVPPGSGNGLTHVDGHGKASMVNISDKLPSTRIAIASGKVLLGPVAFPLVSSNRISKGDVLTVAKLAGICGAKQTGSLIPLCHNINLSNVHVNLELDEQENAVLIKAQATAVGVTGVEMEALTAVSVAALTIYDMCKAVSKHITITNIQLESKTGGKSGNWCRSKDDV
ncbi:hypothetical protein GOP47_0008883 [Adiantum capillus-veneris]|uniref:cyclic pyranopterin monophosphate synthase n=1 Tax=Adiantum capillus-veneris TaxID=13818 RepID=A0A9D4V044_ADICA|nr:hypothetical protein GOP47_0008061 [Adiantum capillus-veneris]KAI5076818.1 hypothetical protein GOP47_0008883 [Adiantum capillus-veneris]